MLSLETHQHFAFAAQFSKSRFNLMQMSQVDLNGVWPNLSLNRLHIYRTRARVWVYQTDKIFTWTRAQDRNDWLELN